MSNPLGHGVFLRLPAGTGKALRTALHEVLQQALGGPLATTGTLCLDFAPHQGWPEPAQERWAVVDGAGQVLAGPVPALMDCSRGLGVGLSLLVQRHGLADWRCAARGRLGVSAAHSDALPLALKLLQELLSEALLSRSLGREPMFEPHAQPQPPQALGSAAAYAWLAGQWRQAWRTTRQRWMVEHWRVGLMQAPIGGLLDPQTMPTVQWITPPESRGYWADPFGMPGRSDLLFCERFDEATQQGHIELMRLAQGQARTLQRLPLGGGRHASFPNAFVVAGKRLGLVETGALRECVLHEVGDDGQWRPLATLLSGTQAADSALFCWQGRWWLAYTDVEDGTWDNLHLAHAEHLQGPWRRMGRVKRDVRGARMAGNFFWHDGSLYRPGQDCAQGYGSGLALYRVLHCSPTGYRETLVRRIAPDAAGACPHGLHTLNAWGELTLVDGKRWCFRPAALWSKLRQRLKRAWPAGLPNGGGTHAA